MKQKIFALGFFDGVHLGHQALLAECVRLSREYNCIAVALTFETHPQALYTDAPPPLLTSAQGREALLRRYGMEQVLILPVNRQVMSTPWEDFLAELVDYGAIGFVCGDDFRFGFRGEGNSEKLRQFCARRDLHCQIVGQQSLDGVRISSSHIRNLLENGDLTQANRFLGHPHLLQGQVVPGRQIGRTMGVPTANLQLDDQILLPCPGVYACVCTVEGKPYPAVTNIGNNPTVGGDRITVEPWLLDFSGDLYGKELTVELHYFLRPEQKFESLDALRAQIQQDAQKTRELLGRP